MKNVEKCSCSLCSQLPAKTTARHWRCPSTPRRWAWSWACALAAWSSSSFCWAPSSSSLRKGKHLLGSLHYNTRLIMRDHIASPLPPPLRPPRCFYSFFFPAHPRWVCFGTLQLCKLFFSVKVTLCQRKNELKGWTKHPEHRCRSRIPHGVPEGQSNTHFPSRSRCQVFN